MTDSQSPCGSLLRLVYGLRSAYVWDGAGHVLAGWVGAGEEEVALSLIRADLFCVLASCLKTVLVPGPELFAHGFPRRDELAEEFCVKFNAPPIPHQLHELSEATFLAAG